mgnify:CR=1 FL=1
MNRQEARKGMENITKQLKKKEIISQFAIF